jgi:hypothetical protein
MLDGLITFFASHHAIRAEKVLRTAEFDVKLIPGPKELSPNCGVALRIEHERRDAATALLAASKVQVDGVMPYEPRTDSWDRDTRRSRRPRFLR